MDLEECVLVSGPMTALPLGHRRQPGRARCQLAVVGTLFAPGRCQGWGTREAVAVEGVNFGALLSHHTELQSRSSEQLRLLPNIKKTTKSPLILTELKRGISWHVH